MAAEIAVAGYGGEAAIAGLAQLAQLMNSRVALWLSLLHAAAIFLGLVQQLAVAAVYGVSAEAGMFFTAMVIPSIIALLYGEALQVSFLPDILRSQDSEIRKSVLSQQLRAPMVLGVASLLVTLGWGGLLQGKDEFDRATYLTFAALLTTAFAGSMLASTLMAWHQAHENFLAPSMVHLLPGVVGTVTVLSGLSLVWVCASYLVTAVIQIAILVLLSADLRKSVFARKGTVPLSRSVGGRQMVAALVVGACLPLAQLIDRLAHSWADLQSGAAAAYAWAVTLGAATVLSRGPNLLFSVWIARPAQGRTAGQALRLPLALYGAGTAAALVVALVASSWDASGLVGATSHASLVAFLAQLMPLLAALGALTALPALHRATAARSGLRFAATAVAAQCVLHVAALGFLMTYFGTSALGFAVAAATQLAVVMLLVIVVRSKRK